MINFREIFNPVYGYMGLIVILLILGLILIINRNIKTSFQIMGVIIITSSILNIIIALIIKLFIRYIIDYNYRIFIEVISDTLFSSLFYKSIVSLVIGILLLIIYKVIPQNRKSNTINNF